MGNLPTSVEFSLITPPSEQRQAPSTEISHREELLRIETHDVITRFGKHRGIATTGNANDDAKYRLDYVKCLATPQIQKGIGNEKMLLRVVEELGPKQDSNDIEPRGFSIRRQIVSDTNKKDEEIIVFIGAEKIENALSEKATDEQINMAMKLLSLIKESLMKLPQPTNPNMSESPIKMKYFPKAPTPPFEGKEGLEALSVSP